MITLYTYNYWFYHTLNFPTFLDRKLKKKIFFHLPLCLSDSRISQRLPLKPVVQTHVTVESPTYLRKRDKIKRI